MKSEHPRINDWKSFQGYYGRRFGFEELTRPVRNRLWRRTSAVKALVSAHRPLQVCMSEKKTRRKKKGR
jgi:hypothetical protein